MGDYLDSPRASKRRKTTTYGSNRTILTDNPSETPATTRSSRQNRPLGKEDNLEDTNNGSLADESKEEGWTDGDALNIRAQEEIHSSHESQRRQRTPASMKKTLPRVRSNTKSTATRTSLRMLDAKADQSENEEISGSAVPERREVTPPMQTVELDEDIEDAAQIESVQPRSSGRHRKPTKRYTISPEKPKIQKQEILQQATEEESRSLVEINTIQTAPLRGILTPSGRKEKRSGPRKSVVFDQKDHTVEEQLGFKDIDTSVKRIARKSNVPRASPKKTENIGKEQDTIPGGGTVLVSYPEAEEEFEEESILTQISDDNIQINDNDSQETLMRELAITDHDTSILEIKSTVLGRLVNVTTSSSMPAELDHLRNQQQALSSLLTATITSGESNSLLLLGSRGSGKMKLVDHVLSNLSSNHPGYFHIVRLNGYFQTDDKLALREIWKQLGRERELEDEETEGVATGTYADTMASLLSLLSHPDEFVNSNEDMDLNNSTEMGFITSKSIVFVLDEFELFTTHPRQTLLYNLFDIAQSKKAPIAVVGCSTRMDVVECLEKRVKSRFSHRWLHVPSIKSLDGFEESVRNVLCVEGQKSTQVSGHANNAMKEWNNYIQSKFLSSTAIQSLIKQVFYTTKSLPELFTALYIPIATLSLPSSLPNTSAKADNAVISISPSIQSPPLILLPTIPTLHMSLLIAAARLDTIYNLAAVNFNLVYNHYVELIAQSKLRQTASGAVAVGAGLKLWGRETAKFAWEELGGWALIVPAFSAGGTKDEARDAAGGEGASVRMWRADVSLDDLVWAVRKKWTSSGGVLYVLSRWCQEV